MAAVTGPKYGVVTETIKPRRAPGRQPAKTFTRPIRRCARGWRPRNQGQICRQHVIIAIEPKITCRESTAKCGAK